jgi:hypothetical protein
MRQLYPTVIATVLLLPTGASARDRLSKDWSTNSQENKVVYYTTDVMPKDAELRIRVVEAGRADIYIYNYNDGGASPQDHRFSGISAGQVLKFKLPFAMRVGIKVGSPAQAACAGIEDKQTYDILKYEFGNIGKFRLDTKVVGEDF